MKLYVGNLPWSISESDLNELFSGVSDVTSVTIIADRDSSAPEDSDSLKWRKKLAIKRLQNSARMVIDNRTLRANEPQRRWASAHS